MDRRQMIDFINNEILPTAEISNDDWFCFGKDIMRNIVKAIEKWRIGENINIEMKGEIKDGVLFLNGDAVKRVAPKMPRKVWDESADYWESRILERQGV